MEEKDKIVDFEKWCGKCIHKNEKETNDPCDECLGEPVNEFGLPLHYKKKE